ncbi:TerB family tellurite resistance protein [Parapedobacter koreensis]|nr:TerB family tellurite resistance protein [Parapedobacter koreensis]
MYSRRKWLEFYRKLGFLLYSIAAVDRHVAPAERTTLKKEIQTNWLDLEDTADPFGSDAAFQMEAIFDWLDDADYAPDSAFNEFEAFVKENPDFIASSLKERILLSANRIAFAFHGNNKKELTLLYQLEQLLNGSKKSV